MPELLQYEGLNWLQYITDWTVPTKDPRSGVVAWVFEGMPEGTKIPWQPWVLPLALWTVFFFALFTLMCSLQRCCVGSGLNTKSYRFRSPKSPLRQRTRSDWVNDGEFKVW